MGLLDDVLSQAAPEGNLSKPLMAALGTLLSGNKSSDAPQSAQSSSASPDGALVAGLGSILEKLQSAGHGETVNSWVGAGPNKPIEPAQLGPAIDPKTVSASAQQAGVSEQELLSQLAAALPGLVNKLMANGSAPSRSA